MLYFILLQQHLRRHHRQVALLRLDLDNSTCGLDPVRLYLILCCVFLKLSPLVAATMSNMAPTPTQSTPDTSRAPSGKSSQTSKPQRVLACVLCQQRKLKCDRKFPCAHCVKSRTQCVTRAQAPRRRRQKFPDRQLLERLGQYEELLRKNNIKFAPPPKISAAEGESSEAKGDREDDVSDDEQQDGVAVDWSTPSSTTFKYEKAHDAK